MAHATVLKGRTIEITWPTTGGDWNIVDDLPGFAKSGLKVANVRFQASAANDTLVIREGSYTGPASFFKISSGIADPKEGMFEGGGRIFPYILYADQVFSVPADISVIINLM